MRCRYFYIVFFVTSFILGNELLFNDDKLFDNYGVSFGGTTMFGCSQCKVDGDRDIGNLNRLNMSFLIKGNHRIDLYYYPIGDDYISFNLPNAEKSAYYQFGTQHFIKNKTLLNLNFDLLTDFMFANENFYERYAIGFGISKMLDSKDYQSYIRIGFNFYNYKSNDLMLLDGRGWLLEFDYPIYMRVLPVDNTPSQFSYILTPQLVLDMANSENDSSSKVYFNCSFDISYAF